jgi:hypothetical protein
MRNYLLDRMRFLQAESEAIHKTMKSPDVSPEIKLSFKLKMAENHGAWIEVCNALKALNAQPA